MVAASVATLNFKGGTREARERRRQFAERTSADPELGAQMGTILAGPESAPAEAFTPGFVARLFGDTAVAGSH